MLLKFQYSWIIKKIELCNVCVTLFFFQMGIFQKVGSNLAMRKLLNGNTVRTHPPTHQPTLFNSIIKLWNTFINQRPVRIRVRIVFLNGSLKCTGPTPLSTIGSYIHPSVIGSLYVRDYFRFNTMLRLNRAVLWMKPENRGPVSQQV
jgi:hypothetical protein